MNTFYHFPKSIVLLATVAWSILGICIPKGFAQDIHFSQFVSAPSNLNPGLLGAFDGDARFIGNGRRQWNSVTIPYQTFGLAADFRNLIKKKKAISFGLNIYNDNTGDSRLNTLQINGAISYSITLNKSKKQYLICGIQSGWTQRSINFSNLRYDNQYNGKAFDPSIKSDEHFETNLLNFLNVHSGIVWQQRTNDRKILTGGIGLYNINTPNQSFVGSTQVPLDRRLNIHADAIIKSSKRIDVLPAVLISFQGTYNEVVLGSSVKYWIHRKAGKMQAVYAGLWSRTVDAGWLSVGMEYNDLNIGLSYDINYSRLQPASRSRGGLEFSAIYIVRNWLPKRKRYLRCPDFL